MQIKENKEKLKKLKLRLAELGIKIKEQRSEIDEHNKNWKQLEKQANQQRGMALTKLTLVGTLERDGHHLQLDIRDLEENIKDQELEKEIVEFTQRQKNFWDVVEIRMAEAQKKANSNLVGFEITRKPSEIIKEIKSLNDNPQHFSQLDAFVRATILDYDKALREIGKLQATGVRVSLPQKMRPTEIIDKMLKNPLMEVRWNT